MNRSLKIGIIGLGLIGGSIFKALSKLEYDLVAVTKSIETIKKAKEYTNQASNELATLKDCDIVFVCSPMNKTLEILDELEEILPASTIVTDVCSLKSFLCTKERKYKFIPSHPMAGTEFKGFDNSFETLFEGAKWIITPFKNTKEEDLNILTGLIEQLGATSLFTTPQEHDEAVALISHMPMLISQAIFKTAKNNNLALKLASSGFRDMTRLAMSNEEMANDMVTLNSTNIEKSVLKLYSAIGELLNKDYIPQIKEIKEIRKKMYSADGKNISI